jgi:hypothetical protein
MGMMCAITGCREESAPFRINLSSRRRRFSALTFRRKWKAASDIRDFNYLTTPYREPYRFRTVPRHVGAERAESGVE